MALRLRSVILAGWASGAVACANVAPAPSSVVLTLSGTDGATYTYPELLRGAPATALVFFSTSCPCVTAHDGRLQAFAERFAKAGVRVYAIDSEYGATVAQDRAQVDQRHYPFPMLIDPGARLAESLGAHFAMFVVIYDASGVLRYRGGFDSDKSVLQDDTQPWAARAMENVLAGQPVAQSDTKALGCALRRW